MVEHVGKKRSFILNFSRRRCSCSHANDCKRERNAIKIPVLSQSTVVRSSSAPFSLLMQDAHVPVGVRARVQPGLHHANVSTFGQLDIYYLRFPSILSYLLVQSGRSDLFDASAAYLANQHSKHRDHVVNYGTRDTIGHAMRLFICPAALSSHT